MSLGPVGASLDPEQAENFEDVSHVIATAEIELTEEIDGKAIRGKRYNSFALILHLR